MSTLLTYLSERMYAHWARQQNHENFVRMYMMDDRQLADIGVTRGDLAFKSQPQTNAAGVEAQKLKAKRRSQKQAIWQLRQMSDADLRDIGITRGTIVESVLYGRDHLRSNLTEQPAPVSQVRKASRAEQKKAARELYAMTDAQLEDMGILRSEIDELVRNGRKPVSQPLELAKGLAAVFKGPDVVASDNAAANTGSNDKAPTPPRSPVNRPAAA